MNSIHFRASWKVNSIFSKSLTLAPLGSRFLTKHLEMSKNFGRGSIKNYSDSQKEYQSLTLFIPPPFVFDSEISGRRPARPPLHGTAGGHKFLDSKVQTLFLLVGKRTIIWFTGSFASSCLALELRIKIHYPPQSF